jgi:K+-sensing histidine kinase KdpD
MNFVQFSSHLIASMSSLKSMFSALAVHLTDFFLERIVEGLGKEAVLKQTWVQGNTSDIHFCSRTNQHNMCEPHRFGNDTHTYQICMEMIHNSVFVSLMGNYSEFSNYRMTIIIVLLIILVIVVALGTGQLFCMLCSTLSAVFHWFTTSKQQLALEQSVSFMKLQVELANLKAYKTCIDVASKRQ